MFLGNTDPRRFCALLAALSLGAPSLAACAPTDGGSTAKTEAKKPDCESLEPADCAAITTLNPEKHRACIECPRGEYTLGMRSKPIIERGRCNLNVLLVGKDKEEGGGDIIVGLTLPARKPGPRNEARPTLWGLPRDLELTNDRENAWYEDLGGACRVARDKDNKTIKLTDVLRGNRRGRFATCVEALMNKRLAILKKSDDRLYKRLACGEMDEKDGRPDFHLDGLVALDFAQASQLLQSFKDTLPALMNTMGAALGRSVADGTAWDNLLASGNPVGESDRALESYGRFLAIDSFGSPQGLIQRLRLRSAPTKDPNDADYVIDNQLKSLRDHLGRGNAEKGRQAVRQLMANVAKQGGSHQRTATVMAAIRDFLGLAGYLVARSEPDTYYEGISKTNMAKRKEHNAALTALKPLFSNASLGRSFGFPTFRWQGVHRPEWLEGKEEDRGIRSPHMLALSCFLPATDNKPARSPIEMVLFGHPIRDKDGQVVDYVRAEWSPETEQREVRGGENPDAVFANVQFSDDRIVTSNNRHAPPACNTWARNADKTFPSLVPEKGQQVALAQ